MAKTICESGMAIIADNAFHIERSDCYAKIGKDVKSVELIRCIKDSLVFIEAKSSFPKPTESVINFQSEIDEICDKFIHSLNLFASIAIGVNEQSLPDVELTDKLFLKFILIINGFEQRWCAPIGKALTNKLRESVCIAKIWKPEVFAINRETAAKRNLIIQ